VYGCLDNFINKLLFLSWMVGKSREADLYAIREYLDRCAESDRVNFHPSGIITKGDLAGEERYIFTPVSKGVLGIPSFQLKGGRVFRRYPLATFSFNEDDEEISVRSGRIFGEGDRNRVSALVRLLEEKPYGELISGLDELKAATEVIKG
jgi:hypothetical protein